MPLCLYDFHLFIPIFMPTALLICMENTFWNITGDGSFVELFKKSFKIYVESGMRKKIEEEVDILRNQSGHLVTNEFKAKFCKIIIEHYLCKFHCFYLHSDIVLGTSNYFRHLNTAHFGEPAPPAETTAETAHPVETTHSVESAPPAETAHPGDQAFDLE
jgi:hypothetical protein